MSCKSGETVQELVVRIRQEAVMCDFASVKDPLDEALRTRFVCSINNKAVLKALFKVNDLTFNKAIEIAMETEYAAKVAKETVHGPKETGAQIHRIHPSGKQSTSRKDLKDITCYCCN